MDHNGVINYFKCISVLIHYLEEFLIFRGKAHKKASGWWGKDLFQNCFSVIKTKQNIPIKSYQMLCM